ncbi:MAG: hypothetical protein HYW70_02335 [Candidatus Nealsonbacteria bacterium]|nr:hypothetical protein [Candidatus Nealsonbacteria bacterium]
MTKETNNNEYNGVNQTRKMSAWILMLIGFTVLGITVHEAGHLMMVKILGGDGIISYDATLLFGSMTVTKMPPNPDHLWLMYPAGGVITALFFFVFFWLPPWLTKTKQDIYVESAASATIYTNLFYAPTELLLYKFGGITETFSWISSLMMMIGLAIAFIFYLKKILNWIDEPSNNNR